VFCSGKKRRKKKVKKVVKLKSEGRMPRKLVRIHPILGSMSSLGVSSNGDGNVLTYGPAKFFDHIDAKTKQMTTGVTCEVLADYDSNKFQVTSPPQVSAMMSEKGLINVYYEWKQAVLKHTGTFGAFRWPKVLCAVDDWQSKFNEKGVKVCLCNLKEVFPGGEGGQKVLVRWFEYIDMETQPNYVPADSYDHSRDACCTKVQFCMCMCIITFSAIFAIVVIIFLACEPCRPPGSRMCPPGRRAAGGGGGGGAKGSYTPGSGGGGEECGGETPPPPPPPPPPRVRALPPPDPLSLSRTTRRKDERLMLAFELGTRRMGSFSAADYMDSLRKQTAEAAHALVIKSLPQLKVRGLYNR
jgi:hypothetical protein